MILAIAGWFRRLFRRRRAFWFCRQHDSADCGPACVAMVARYHGRKLSLQSLREISHTTRQGSSLLSISAAAEKTGFRTLRARTSFDHLACRAPLPCIVHWRQRHFVVVYEIESDRVRVADPAAGLITYDREEFLQGWLSGQRATGEFGIVLLLEPTEALHEQEEGVPDRSSRGLRGLVPRLRGYGPYGFRLGIGVVAAAALQLALPFLTQALVDLGIATQDLGLIWLILIGQLVLIVSRTMVDFVQGWVMLHVGTRVNIDLVTRFLSKLMRLPIGYFESRTTTDILQRIDDHVRVEQLLTQSTANLLNSIFSFVVFGGALLYYSPTGFGIFLVGGLGYAAVISYFFRKRSELDEQRFRQLSVTRNVVLELVRGMPEVKTAGAEQVKRWEWEAAHARLHRLTERSLRLDQYQQGGAVFLMQGTNAIITAHAAVLVINGSLTLGGLLAMQYLLGQLNAPLAQLLPLLRSVQDARLSLDRIEGVHATADEEPPGLTALVPEDSSIHLNNVRFGYQGSMGPLVFDGLSLCIPNGKLTAVVGSSGSGKTTLMKLLLKLYEPLGGSIYLNDTALAKISHRTWRRECGAVMQDGHVFNDSIARNVSLGDDEIDEERVLHATHIACLDEVIERLPLGYNTRLGNDGIGLSQGQRQRLLIARAIYQNPRFLFFDEATSALDAETERRIVENLARFFRGRTVLVIAHRLSTVRHADHIVVLERGQIVENGTHDELVVTQQGRYFDLVKNQLELSA